MSKYRTEMQWGNGRWVVALYRDDKPVALMSIEDWAALSATEHVLKYRPRRLRAARPVTGWLAAGKGKAAQEAQ
jgi:hypothetical protein